MGSADPSGLGARRLTGQAALKAFLDGFLSDTRASGRWVAAGLPAPSASVNFGAAGIALALCRLAAVRGEDALLHQAREWLVRADEASREPGAFEDGEYIRPDVVGRVSPFHAASGLEYVRAVIARQSRDIDTQRYAIDAYLRNIEHPCSNLDLTLGLSSALLGCALLYEGADSGWAVTAELAKRGDRLCAEIWTRLPGAEPGYLGIAHGLAGIVYAALMWADVRGLPAPDALPDVLERLAGAGAPHGRGIVWPTTARGAEAWPGWCHGQAGYVFLWTLAAEVYGAARFDALAEGAAWSTWERAPQHSSLCCGAAGAAYALLNHHRRTGERAWARRAAAIAGKAAQADTLGAWAKPHQLYKGHVGLSLLAAELERPEAAAMPLFEPERSAHRL